MPNEKYVQHPPKQIKPGVTRSIIFTDRLMSAILDFTNGPWSEPEPYHSHPHEQTTYVAKGEIVVYREGEPEARLGEGQAFAVPSGVKHTIKLLTKTVRLVDNFTPIREDFLEP